MPNNKPRVSIEVQCIKKENTAIKQYVHKILNISIVQSVDG
jgi:hypothetical protein